MSDRILPFTSARYHFGDLGKPMLFHEVIRTIIHVPDRNGEDNLINGLCGLKNSHAMDDEWFAAQGKKLLRDRSTHPESSAGGRNYGDDSSSLTGDRFDARRASRGHMQGCRTRRDFERIRCNTLITFSGPERRTGSRIVRRS
jgi:hypothetical protein